MIRARVLFALSLLAPLGCLPDNPCDPGYQVDHGACYPRASMLDGGLRDASAEREAGGGDPNASFGKPCTSEADCGGPAPACGAPQLPYCTALNCMGNPGTCPARWTCLDARGLSPNVDVHSLCLKP